MRLRKGVGKQVSEVTKQLRERHHRDRDENWRAKIDGEHSHNTCRQCDKHAAGRSSWNVQKRATRKKACQGTGQCRGPCQKYSCNHGPCGNRKSFLNQRADGPAEPFRSAEITANCIGKIVRVIREEPRIHSLRATKSFDTRLSQPRVEFTFVNSMSRREPH